MQKMKQVVYRKIFNLLCHQEDYEKKCEHEIFLVDISYSYWRKSFVYYRGKFLWVLNKLHKSLKWDSKYKFTPNDNNARA